jgi:hypothetical protein
VLKFVHFPWQHHLNDFLVQPPVSVGTQFECRCRASFGCSRVAITAELRAGLSPLFSQDGQIFYFPAPISCLGEPGIGQLLVFRPEFTSSSRRCSPSTHDAQAKFCASGRLRWFSVCQVVKTAQSRERTERTLLTRWFRLSAGTLVEQGDAADRRDPSLSHFRLRSPGSSCRQALMLFRRLAAHARVESAGARPSRAVLARRR